MPWFSEFYATIKQHLMIAKYLSKKIVFNCSSNVFLDLLGITPFLPIPGTENLPEPQRSEYIHFLTQCI